MFPGSSQRRPFKITHLSTNLAPSGHESKLLHPSITDSLDRPREGLGSRITAVAHCFSLLLSSIMPSKNKAPESFLKQKKSEKTCIWKDDTNFKGKMIYCQVLVVIYFKIFLMFFKYFFLALVSKSKKQYKHLSKRTVEKSWKIERRDCCKFSSEKEPKKKKPQRALFFFSFLKQSMI